MVKYRRKSVKFDIINTIICIGIFLVLFFKLKFGIIISTILSIIIYTGSSLLFAPSNKLELMGITDLNKQKECEELLNRGYNQLNNLIYLKNKITKANPKKEFIKMTEKINNILKYLEKHPNKIEENKKFFTYYLETILKVSNSYYDISSQEVHTEEIEEVMKKTENSLEVINKSLESQFSKILQNDALDLDTEIELLNNSIDMEDF